MVAVIEPMVWFIQPANRARFLNITAASGYFASCNPGPFAPRSSLRPNDLRLEGDRHADIGALR
jgi:hypothetical protein